LQLATKLQRKYQSQAFDDRKDMMPWSFKGEEHRRKGSEMSSLSTARRNIMTEKDRERI